MRPEEPTISDNPLVHNGIFVNLDDDLSRYLTFLEKNKLVKRREDIVLASLRIYKKLNMHDWLPHVYRSGGERVLLMGHNMLHDIFTSMSRAKLYEVARMTALKRRMIDPVDEDLDLSEPSNWGVVLNELENMGWGRFTHQGNEVMVEFLGVPIDFLRGYLETMFKVEMKEPLTKVEGITVFIAGKQKLENYARARVDTCPSETLKIVRTGSP